MTKYHIQGEVTIYIDYEDEEDFGECTPKESVEAYRKWLIEEYRLHSLSRGEIDFHLVATPLEEVTDD